MRAVGRGASRSGPALLLLLAGCCCPDPAPGSVGPGGRAVAAAADAPAPPSECVAAAQSDVADPSPPVGSGVWGILGLGIYPLADKIAPNGVEYTPIFSLNYHPNLWLSPSQGVYLFADAEFWGQKAAPGVTNRSQGALDFSKREFDLDGGLAWNWDGRWEARAFAYSLNNLNRGTSVTAPAGYADGVGLEGRYYLSDVYDALGTPAFDVARAGFVSLGYYPTKDLVDNQGQPFRPGPFARAYLTVDLLDEWAYLYADAALIGTRAGSPKLIQADCGAAARPFVGAPRWEFRAGARGSYDVNGGDLEREIYLMVRFIY
jgi:hypothetical protein